ncbi:hypothetical protein L9F63_008064, partial [Diploptera punctata]
IFQFFKCSFNVYSEVVTTKIPHTTSYVKQKWKKILVRAKIKILLDIHLYFWFD